MPKAFLVRKRPLPRKSWVKDTTVGINDDKKKEMIIENMGFSGERGQVSKRQSDSRQRSAESLQTCVCVQDLMRERPDNYLLSRLDDETISKRSSYHCHRCTNSACKETANGKLSSLSHKGENHTTHTTRTVVNTFSPVHIGVPFSSNITTSASSSVPSTSSSPPTSSSMKVLKKSVENVSSVFFDGSMKSPPSAFQTNGRFQKSRAVSSTFYEMSVPYSSGKYNTTDTCPDRLVGPHTPVPIPYLLSCYQPSSPRAFAYSSPNLSTANPISRTSWPLHPVPLRFASVLSSGLSFSGPTSPEQVIPSLPVSPVSGVHATPQKDVRLSRHVTGSCSDNSLKMHVKNNNNRSDKTWKFREGDSCWTGVLNYSKQDQAFRNLLESAKVRVEIINDGNGLKNPLLSSDATHLNAGTARKSFANMTSSSCPVCGVACDSLRLLQRHLRGHKEIKRYLCAWCGKGFNDTFDLKRHTRTHTGVRPYKCDSCGKAFTQRCSLESHSRKIHGIKLPFTFNERRAKLYVCEECGHSTSCLDNHFRHLRVHHPGNPVLNRQPHDGRQFPMY